MKYTQHYWWNKFSTLIFLTSLYSTTGYAQTWSKIDSGLDSFIGTHQAIVTGDFNGNGRDGLMTINVNGLNEFALAHFRTHYTPYFYVDWRHTALGRTRIGAWNITANDKFITGDFTGDGKDELLIANPNSKKYQTLTYFSSYTIQGWLTLSSHSNGNINISDRYLVGDFDNDNRDELLAIHADGSHYTLEYNNNNWDIVESGNNGQIKWWNLNSNDRYAVGDFDGDGKDELLATNQNGWHHTMKFDGTDWQYIEGGNNGFIAQWNMTNGDRFVTGDFNCNGKDELLANNGNNGWSHTMSLSNGAWPQWQIIPQSNNQGNQYFAGWALDSQDRYYAGKFWTSPCETVISLNNIDWHLSELMP